MNYYRRTVGWMVLVGFVLALWISNANAYGQPTQIDKTQASYDRLTRQLDLQRRKDDTDAAFARGLHQIDSMFAGDEMASPKLQRLQQDLMTVLRRIMALNKGNVDARYMQELNALQIENIRQYNPKQADQMSGIGVLVQIFSDIEQQQQRKQLASLNDQADALNSKIRAEKSELQRQQEIARQASAQIKEKNWLEAEVLFKQLTRIDSENPAYTRGYAFALQNQAGKEQQAIEAYRATIERQPREAAGYVDLSRLLQRLDKPDDAAHEIEQACRFAFNDAKTWAARGSILADKPNYAAALSCYDRAARLEPSDSAIAKERNEVGQIADAYYRDGIRKNPDDALSYMHLGSALIAQGHFQDAADALNQARQKGAADAWTYSELSDALLGCGRIDEALAAAKVAVEKAPDQTILRFLQGMLLLRQGKVRDAWVILREARNARSGDAVMVAGYRRACEQLIPELRQAMASENLPVDEVIKLSHACLDLGRNSDAEAALRLALTQNPRSAAILVELAQVCLRKNAAESVELIQQAIKIKPEEAGYYASLAHAFSEVRKYGDAIKTIRQAIKIDASSIVYRDHLWSYLHADDKFREAVEAARATVQLASSNANIPYYQRNLAASLSCLGSREKNKDRKTACLQESTDLLRKALQSIPEDGNAHAWLAATLKCQGWTAEARTEAQQAVRLGSRLDWVLALLD